MNRAILLGALILSACANNNNYTALPNASQTAMWDNLDVCRHSAFHAYYEGRGDGGALVGGVIAGPLGALAGSAMDSSGSGVKPSDIQPMEIRCMADRGYVKGPN